MDYKIRLEEDSLLRYFLYEAISLPVCRSDFISSYYNVIQV